MHHNLDVTPYPDEHPLYINDLNFADESVSFYGTRKKKKKPDPDEIRIYVPLDISKYTILRRLRCVISKYGEANEKNEINYSVEVSRIIRLIEVYDQIWLVRDNDYKPDKNGMLGGHSRKAKELVREFIKELEDIPDGCAECFPFEEIDKLTSEYLSEE